MVDNVLLTTHASTIAQPFRSREYEEASCLECGTRFVHAASLVPGVSKGKNQQPSHFQLLIVSQSSQVASQRGPCQKHGGKKNGTRRQDRP